jgi:hypothetical protein
MHPRPNEQNDEGRAGDHDGAPGRTFVHTVEADNGMNVSVECKYKTFPYIPFRSVKVLATFTKLFLMRKRGMPARTCKRAGGAD